MSGLRRLLSVISPRYREPVKCEGCGADFTCGASLGGCWCMKVEVSREARAELRTQFNACVCRECLEKAQRTASQVTGTTESAVQRSR
jgi:hypothetical protein